MRALLVFVCVFWVACSPGLAEPVDPVWGKQSCAHCSMLVSERAPAAQLIAAQGERLFFDDIGCMVLWLSEASAAPRASWVRTPGGGSWQTANTAHYRDGQRTPMDYGFLPADQGISFSELAQRLRHLNAQRGVAPHE